MHTTFWFSSESENHHLNTYNILWIFFSEFFTEMYVVQKNSNQVYAKKKEETTKMMERKSLLSAECRDPKIDAINLFQIFFVLFLFYFSFSIHKRENDTQHVRSPFEYIFVYITQYTVKSSRCDRWRYSQISKRICSVSWFKFICVFHIHFIFFFLIRCWPTSTKISI